MRGNALKGSAQFTHNEREYLLVLDNSVWIEAEDVLGYSILDAVEELRAAIEAGRNPKLKVMAAIVYGGLKANHPDVTEQDVVEMFFSNNAEFKDAVLQAMQGAQLPDYDSTAGEAPGNGQGREPKEDGTGSKYSRPGANRASSRKASGKKPRDR